MIFWIFGILAIIFCVVLYNKGCIETIGGTIGTFILIICCYIGSVFIIEDVSAEFCGKYKIVYTESCPIASLVRENSISGSFVLGTGYIGSDIYYVYYKIIGKNKYTLEKAYATNYNIIEDNSVKPCIAYDLAKRDAVISNIWFPYIDKTINYDIISINHRIIVPVGTIIKQFRLE